MKLEKLHVKNFKSLQSTEIASFKQKNLFYGYNNSGKSNIFKFLNILFKRKSIKNPVEVEGKSEFTMTNKGFWDGDIYDEPFLFCNNDRNKPIEFQVSVILKNDEIPDSEFLKESSMLGESETSLELNGQIVSKDVSVSSMLLTEAKINNATFYTNIDSVESFFPDSKDKNRFDRKMGESILSILNDSILYVSTDRNFTKELFSSFEGNMSSKNFKNWLFDLNIDSDKNEDFVSLIEFLQKFDFTDESKKSLDFNLKSFPFGKATKIGFTKFENEVEIMLENEAGRFPLANYGTGIQQFFYLLVKIFWSKSKIVIIEELELNLSPLYQKELLRFLTGLIENDLFHQLLFSSHSPYFTKEHNFMVDVIHHVEILEKGTEVNSYEDPKAIYDPEIDHSLISLLYS